MSEFAVHLKLKLGPACSSLLLRAAPLEDLTSPVHLHITLSFFPGVQVRQESRVIEMYFGHRVDTLNQMPNSQGPIDSFQNALQDAATNAKVLCRALGQF